MNALDYEALASGMDQLRETLKIMVAGLVEDGFSEDQARMIVTGLFAPANEDSEED